MVKSLAAQVWNLSLISGTFMKVEGEKKTLKVVLKILHLYHVMNLYTHMCAHACLCLYIILYK